MLSLKLARALQGGRAGPAPAPTREKLLIVLLRKRATAHNMGDAELEAMLRDQIRWSLPMLPVENEQPD